MPRLWNGTRAHRPALGLTRRKARGARATIRTSVCRVARARTSRRIRSATAAGSATVWSLHGPVGDPSRCIQGSHGHAENEYRATEPRNTREQESESSEAGVARITGQHEQSTRTPAQRCQREGKVLARLAKNQDGKRVRLSPHLAAWRRRSLHFSILFDNMKIAAKIAPNMPPARALVTILSSVPLG